MVIIIHLFKMFKSNCTLSIVKLLLYIIKHYTLSEHIWRSWPKPITSFPSFCTMQQFCYQSATPILNILTNFAEFAVATMIISTVKMKCRNSDFLILTFLISRLLKIFLTSIIYISVNNLVLISSLSSEKESLFLNHKATDLECGFNICRFLISPRSFYQEYFLGYI